MLCSASPRSGNAPRRAYAVAKFLCGFMLTVFLMLGVQCAKAQDGPMGGIPNVTYEYQYLELDPPGANGDGLIHGTDKGHYFSGFSDPTITALIMVDLFVDNTNVGHTFIGMGYDYIDMSFDPSKLASGTHTVEFRGIGVGHKNGDPPNVYVSQPGDQTLWDLRSAYTKS